MDKLKIHSIALSTGCILMLILIAIFGVVTSCTNKNETSNKKIVYEIYRENPDGSKTKWVNQEFPAAYGTYLRIKAPNGGMMLLFDRITVVPVEVIVDTLPEVSEEQAESKEDKMEQN